MVVCASNRNYDIIFKKHWTQVILHSNANVFTVNTSSRPHKWHNDTSRMHKSWTQNVKGNGGGLTTHKFMWLIWGHELTFPVNMSALTMQYNFMLILLTFTRREVKLYISLKWLNEFSVKIFLLSWWKSITNSYSVQTIYFCTTFYLQREVG